MTRIPEKTLKRADEIGYILSLSPMHFMKKYMCHISKPSYNKDEPIDPNQYLKIGKLVATFKWSSALGWIEIRYDDELVCSTDTSNFFFNYGDWMIEYIDYLKENGLIEEKT